MHKWTYHGGRLNAAETAWPDAPRPWIDLSTGLNPLPYPTTGVENIDWAALPDETMLADLESAAANYFGAAQSRVCALPGTEIGIRLLPAIGLPQPIRHVAPAYGSYAAAFPEAQPIAAEDVVQQSRLGGTIILANPNNPDGRLWPVPMLLEITENLARSGGVLVVDEAFADAVPDHSIIPHLAEANGNVVVLRSFGKFFGLGGLRLGFMIAGEQWLTALRRLVGSWPVSAAAIMIGRAAYRDQQWIGSAHRRIGEDAARLDDLLASHGLAARGDCPLFRLIETPHAARLFEMLANRGILTRPFDYAPHWLRLGLPGHEDAWDRLDKALGAAHG